MMSGTRGEYEYDPVRSLCLVHPQLGHAPGDLPRAQRLDCSRVVFHPHYLDCLMVSLGHLMR